MSSPAMSSRLLQHRSSPVRLIDPVTLESVDHAKIAANKERAYDIAMMLGIQNGINIRTCSSRQRVELLDIGLRSVLDSQKAPAL